MIKHILFFLLFVGAMQAQSDTSDPLAEPSMEESLNEAFSEISKFLDTLDGNSIMGLGMDSMMMKAFSFDGENMKELDGVLDSMGISKMLGGTDISKMLEGGIPGIEGMDMNQMNQMMEQSLKMLEGIDISQMQKMMEGIDMSELMKMFEGMDMEGFMPPADKAVPSEKDKKLKKI